LSKALLTCELKISAILLNICIIVSFATGWLLWFRCYVDSYAKGVPTFKNQKKMIDFL